MRGSMNNCAHPSGQEDSEPGVMADRSGFQAQIASVIEILANSAVVEICRLVEDGYTALWSQMDQEREKSQKENDVLRQKLRETDEKLRSCERKLRRRRRQEKMFAVHLNPVREAQNSSEETPSTDTVFDTGTTSLASSPPHSPSSPTDVMMDLTYRPGAKCNLMKPLWRSLKISSGILQDTETACRDFPESQTDCPLKPKIQPDETTDDEVNPSRLSVCVELEEPNPDHLNNPSLDLAWMQERAGHLGAAYAVAQLGLGNTNTGHPLSALLSQGEGDSLDGPPTMLFTSGTNKIAAFSPSFNVSAVNAAVIAGSPSPLPAVSTASSASIPSQMQPFRCRAAFTKKHVVCAVCSQVFSSAAALKLHQQVHTEERPYTCRHCGKGFAQPNNLKVHLLVHTGERRYRCTLCGKGFISSSHLKRHLTVHTQEKPYSCSRCGQSFSQMCSVRRHRQQSQCGL
ncbi:zinc finger protein 354C [Kryptolebias marmoratus]|uniref:Zinc finger protein 354C-like n=1 Tax=Kryptolebias marmoratus TaxID=37003 RepID=A0A3Q3BCR2_KRYMA|nr:zinc finger protein 354C [Kryptolebias marmoratus]